MTTEEIDALTIADVRRIVERAGEALKALADLGIAPQITGAGLAASGRSVARPMVASLAPTSPYPCAMCSREGPVSPAEQAQLGDGAPECNACGNPMAPVGAKTTNKGPVVLSAQERAWKLSQPAFDKNGEPA